jgi:single-strand DNA-binding protein
MDYQKITVLGNVTSDPQVNQPDGKTTYVDFSVGVSRGRVKEGREAVSDYFPVRAFGKLAPVAEQISKGTRLLVEGRLEINTVAAKDNPDQKRTFVRIVPQVIVILSPKAE